MLLQSKNKNYTMHLGLGDYTVNHEIYPQDNIHQNTVPAHSCRLSGAYSFQAPSASPSFFLSITIPQSSTPLLTNQYCRETSKSFATLGQVN